MNFVKVEYVEASELFADCHNAWNIFSSSEPPCTWGDNAKSLVSAWMIAEKLLEEEDDDLEEDDDNNKQIKKVLKRIKDNKKDFLVDLEN